MLFIELYKPTIEEAHSLKRKVDDKMCQLHIYDTSGNDDHTTIRDQVIQDADGFVIVYSVCSQQSFDSVKRFYNKIRTQSGQGSFESNVVISLWY